MTYCPKCGFGSQGPFDECPRCGIVVRKFKRPVDPNTSRGGHLVWARGAGPDASAGWSLAMAPVRAKPLAFFARLLLLAFLSVWSVHLFSATPASTVALESFLHLVNLPIHEAGHVVFAPFGDFAGSMGGSLLQLLVPLVCGLALLLRRRDSFGAAVAFWWLGENFLDLSPYIYDARIGQLPLLGGNTGQTSPYGFHDWNYLLSEIGLLEYDYGIAWSVHLTGVLIMLLSLGWCAVYLLQQKDRISSE